MNAPARSSTMRSSWCGPYAIAVCLGITYDEAYALIKKALRTKMRITSMYDSWVTKALKRGGLRVKTFEPPARYAKVKLGGWPTLRNLADYLKPNRLYIVRVTDHYITVDTRDWTAIDNNGRGWFPVDWHRMANRKVRCVLEVKRT